MSGANKKIHDYFTSRVNPEMQSEDDGIDDEQSQPVAGDGSQIENEAPSTELPSCECPCCTNYTTPHQPMNLDSSKRRHSYLTKQGDRPSTSTMKSHSRTIQNSGFLCVPLATKCSVQAALMPEIKAYFV